MVLDYHDQLTGGGMNLFGLQCLTHSIHPNLVVVEPFVVGSTFGAALDIRNVSASEMPWKGDAVRMSDVYNMEKWLQYSEKNHYAPLVTWEAFLEEAPRDVVLVQHVWNDGCGIDKHMYTPFLQLYRFRVVREVCLNFRYSGALKLWQFKDIVYGHLDPQKLTVIYQMWMKIATMVEKYAINIISSPCAKGKVGVLPFKKLHASPSEKLYTQAELYVSRFLSGVTDHMYIAVMLRIERMFLQSSDRLNLLSICLDNLIKEWEYMKNATGITTTFVALDYGTYGSKGFLLREYVDTKPLEDKLVALLHTMGQGNFSEWESRFAEAAGTQNPGYIASLQRIIASKARCLITAGEGTFQDHAFALHESFFGKTCSIRLRKDCTLMDSFVKFSLPNT